jgi:hypothetical protein
MTELTRRYLVMAMATEAPFDHADPEGVFVLKPWKDPAALRALMTYRENCYPELGHELEAWIRAIEAGPVVRGGVGQRNESHLRHALAPPRRGTRARPATRRRSRQAPRARRGAPAARKKRRR